VTTDITLIEKRENLKRQLAAGEYKTLMDVCLEWFEHLLRKVARRKEPVSIWAITTILSLGLTLLGFVALYISGELLPTNDAFKKLGLTFEIGTLWLILLNALNITSMVLLNNYTNRIFIFWRDNLLDAIESIKNIDEFETWLKTTCNKRQHLISSLIGGSFFSLYVVVASIQRGILFSYGSVFGLYILCMVASSSIYLLWTSILLSAKLYRYEIKLLSIDPSSSELISRLSATLGLLIYIIASSGAVGALLTALSGELLQILGVVQILVIWLPLGVVFSINQTSLASIIRRAKWKTLNEIQSQVEELRAMNNLKDKETMEAINRLMDFHDRVKATRNSAIDSGTILNFINSLLLPLLAFLLGNLDKVLLLFSRKP
jgi:hypothetical protein